MSASNLDHRWKKLRKWAKANLEPICGVCGWFIDLSIPYPDKWSCSVDHIIPLSKRPDLAYDKANVTLTHMTCNSRKQDRTARPTRTEIDWLWDGCTKLTSPETVFRCWKPCLRCFQSGLTSALRVIQRAFRVKFRSFWTKLRKFMTKKALMKTVLMHLWTN